MQLALVDDVLCPLEGMGLGNVGCHEGLDGLSDLLDRGGAGSLESTATQDAEPHLDHVEPAGVGRREEEVDIGVTGKPATMFGLVRIEVVEDD